MLNYAFWLGKLFGVVSCVFYIFILIEMSRRPAQKPTSLWFGAAICSLLGALSMAWLLILGGELNYRRIAAAGVFLILSLYSFHASGFTPLRK